jgi:Hemerythrin HHE cation binding domain
MPATSTPYPEPLGRMCEALKTKQWICDLAETIADTLPEPSSLVCLRVAVVLRNDLPLYHADCGRCLFPRLRLRHSGIRWLVLMLEQIEAEHSQIEIAVDEVADLLERIGSGRANVQERNVAGYALRGFFEGLRRHISWERNLILPLAHESLTADDLLIIAQGIEQNRRMPPRSSVLRAFRGIE